MRLSRLRFSAIVLLAASSPGLASQPIGLVMQANFSFGSIVASGTAGTVTVTPASLRSSAGGVVLGSGVGVHAATFQASGALEMSFSIVLPSSVTLTSGGSTMTMNAFTSNPSGSGTIGIGGTTTVTVGATLNVGANQSTGSYTGSLPVTVAYS
jgi:hypothetical protein